MRLSNSGTESALQKPGILGADRNIRDLSVRVATQLDVEAVSTLLVANSAEHGGQLYGNWSVGDVKNGSTAMS
jgi:hypothetical protein